MRRARHPRRAPRRRRRPAAVAAGEDRRRGQLELYRSGDFEKLARYDGALAGLGVPTLLLWGEKDGFAPVASARRFAAELPDTRLVIVEGAGHFVFEDAPQRCAQEVAGFLGRLL